MTMAEDKKLLTKARQAYGPPSPYDSPPLITPPSVGTKSHE